MRKINNNLLFGEKIGKRYKNKAETEENQIKNESKKFIEKTKQI